MINDNVPKLLDDPSCDNGFYIEWLGKDGELHEVAFANKRLYYVPYRYLTIRIGQNDELCIPEDDIIKLVINDHCYIDRRE